MATVNETIALYQAVNDYVQGKLTERAEFLERLEAVNLADTDATAQLDTINNEYQTWRTAVNEEKSRLDKLAGDAFDTLSSDNDKKAVNGSSTLANRRDLNNQLKNAPSIQGTTDSKKAQVAKAKAEAAKPAEAPADSAAAAVKDKQAAGDSTASTQKPQDDPTVKDPATKVVADSTTATTKTVSADDAALAKQVKTIESPRPTDPTVKPAILRPNPLRVFASYTYNLSLELTTPQMYNKMLEGNPTKYDVNDWVPIIASGGTGPNKAQWPKGQGKKYFTKDFYIDDLTMKGIVGQSADARGTNIQEFHFKITEPYGMSFIEELHDFTKDGLKEKNYLELPWMLKVRFIGYDDNGKLIEGGERLTKYLPIKINQMNVTVTSAGAIYDCTAIPYGAQAQGDKYGRLGKDIELKGKTLVDICHGKAAVVVPDKAGDTKDATIKGKDPAEAAIMGLAEVMTKDSEALTKPKDPAKPDTAAQNVADQYEIEFIKTTVSYGDKTEDIDIGTFLLASPEDITKAQTPMAKPPVETNGSDSKVDTAAMGQNLLAYQYLSKDVPKVDIDTKTAVVKFKAGSGIFDILSQLIQNSKYVTDQVAEFREAYNKAIKIEDAAKRAEELKSLSKPIKWFKLIPDIRLLEYDDKRSVYAKKIIIKVIPYLIDDARVPFAPKQSPASRVVKNYDYLFTGNNSEVINFALTFNTAYMQYNTTNYDTKAMSSGSKKPSETEEVNREQTTPTPVNVAVSKVPSPGAPSSPRGIGQLTPDRARSADMSASIYSKADLVNLDIDIMGDPDFIKQDDIFYKPQQGDVADVAIAGGPGQPEGIRFDSGQIYARVNFLTPQDYDDNSGIMILGDKKDEKTYRRSVFSGIYNVQQVDVTLSGGKFTQKLTGMRVEEEEAKLVDKAPPPAQANTTAKTADDPAKKAPVKKDPVAPPKTTTVVNDPQTGAVTDLGLG